MHRVSAFLGALVAALVLASVAAAAAPNYILVSGPGLARPVLLADWNENGDLLVATLSAPRANKAIVRGLLRRPRLDLAEFWGWSDLPGPTRPSQANQHGWFYPAYRGGVPLISLTVDGLKVPRLASPAALRIFARHGIPTRLKTRHG